MSYTKKSTEELEKRLQIDFNLPVTVTTFHSLGFMHIREIFHNRKCYVVDENLQNEIFLNYFIEKIFPNKERVKEIISLFDNNINVNGKWMFSRHFRENYSKYQTFEEFFKFMSVANKQCEEKGRTYEFECPICKGKSKCYKEYL